MALGKDDLSMIDEIVNTRVSDIMKQRDEMQQEKNRMSKAEIMGIKNRRERQKAIKNNMDLFK